MRFEVMTALLLQIGQTVPGRGALQRRIACHDRTVPEPVRYEVVPRFVDLEVAVPHLSPAVW
jgi:hypothetical protein